MDRLRPLRGLSRPSRNVMSKCCWSVTRPFSPQNVDVSDVGANVDCTAQHLAQFAIMGNEYGKYLFGKPNPRVGLLSIGEEDSKGNEVTKEAFKLLKTSPLNFIGNIEGRDVYSGNADVVVCDGFIGNVALKISEGVADTIKKLLIKEIS